jgi:hypothetical protein
MKNNRYIINFRLTWPVQKSVFVEVHPIIFKLFDWYNWNVVLKISILLDSTKYYIEEGWKKLWKKKK